jgi:Sialidase, N-terminal domain.
MYWGNANAPGVSNGAAVFDTADGFAAVWHFNNNCGDATANNYAGTNFGAIDTEGIIGNSKKFNGADSIRIVGLLGSPASVSLSAWAQLDSSSSYGGAEIVSLGDVAAIRMDDYRPNYGTMGTVHVSTTNNDTIFNDITSGGLDLAKTGWHYVAMTIDDANRLQSLYIDGTRYNQISNNALVNYSGVGINTLIGKHGNGKNNYNFIGSIDEVRVNKTVLSADWIRLCYMNQKASDMLVRFGK